MCRHQDEPTAWIGRKPKERGPNAGWTPFFFYRLKSITYLRKSSKNSGSQMAPRSLLRIVTVSTEFLPLFLKQLQTDSRPFYLKQDAFQKLRKEFFQCNSLSIIQMRTRVTFLKILLMNWALRAKVVIGVYQNYCRINSMVTRLVFAFINEHYEIVYGLKARNKQISFSLALAYNLVIKQK